MKGPCVITTAKLRVYTTNTTTRQVPAIRQEGSCSPNLPWPQSISTQDCRQPTPTIGTNDEIPRFGHDSVNGLHLLGGTQPPLPFCFGSSSTSNAQAKFTWSRLLLGSWGAETTGTCGSHQSPFLVQVPQTVLSPFPQSQGFPSCHSRECALGLPLSNLLVILTSACLCGFCLLLPNPWLSQPRLLPCPRFRLYQGDSRGIHTQVT